MAPDFTVVLAVLSFTNIVLAMLNIAALRVVVNTVVFGLRLVLASIEGH